MHVAVVYNEPDAAPHRAEAEIGVIGQVQRVASVLRRAGHAVRLVAAEDAGRLCADLQRDRPDFVFNCCEALRGRSAFEMNVAALFELLDLPFTGSPPLTLGLALNKPLCQSLIRAHGIPTPAHAVFEPGDTPSDEGLAYPLIVKPATEDGSIGIDAGAVVRGAAALKLRVAYIWEMLGQAALVETFVDGREFNVALLARADGPLEALPIGEIVFDELPPGRPPILDYDAKWNAHAAFRQVDASRCPADIGSGDAARLARLALDAARVVGVRDYVRVELRQRASDGAPFVIELNPNPDLNAECEFARCAQAGGHRYDAMILAVARRAMACARANATRIGATS